MERVSFSKLRYCYYLGIIGQSFLNEGFITRKGHFLCALIFLREKYDNLRTLPENYIQSGCNGLTKHI